MCTAVLEFTTSNKIVRFKKASTRSNTLNKQVLTASQATLNTENSNSALPPSQSKILGNILLTRNVEVLRRTLNELFHLLAARKLFLILLLNFLNRLLRCGDIQVSKNRESLPDARRNTLRGPSVL